MMTLFWRRAQLHRPWPWIALIGLILAGCAPDIAQTLSLPSVSRVGPITATMHLDFDEHTPVNGAAIELTATQPGQAPVRGRARQTAPGSYEVPFTWPAPGMWTIVTTSTLPGGDVVVRDMGEWQVRP
jgi:hypothetical protein